MAHTEQREKPQKTDRSTAPLPANHGLRIATDIAGLIDRFAYGPQGLNMIPGGFKGLRYLHKLGIIARQNISLAERDRVLGEYLRQNPRKGIPNPFMAELWKDDDHYLRVNEAHPKRLSKRQALRIRELDAEGRSIEEIVDEVDALDEKQVKRVIDGQTYQRVHQLLTRA